MNKAERAEDGVSLSSRRNCISDGPKKFRGEIGWFTGVGGAFRPLGRGSSAPGRNRGNASGPSAVGPSPRGAWRTFPGHTSAMHADDVRRNRKWPPGFSATLEIATSLLMTPTPDPGDCKVKAHRPNSIKINELCNLHRFIGSIRPLRFRTN